MNIIFHVLFYSSFHHQRRQILAYVCGLLSICSAVALIWRKFNLHSKPCNLNDCVYISFTKNDSKKSPRKAMLICGNYSQVFFFYKKHLYKTVSKRDRARFEFSTWDIMPRHMNWIELFITAPMRCVFSRTRISFTSSLGVLVSYLQFYILYFFKWYVYDTNK